MNPEQLASVATPPPVTRPVHSAEVVELGPRSGWRALELRELWRYRELVGFLALRDIKLRYKQTLLGAAWAVLQPTLTMLVFSLFFGRLAKLDSEGVPYPVFTFCALLPWQLFSFSLSQAGNSLVNEQRLISKVYFPRLIIPIASVGAGLLDFAISLGVLLMMMAWYGLAPTWGIVTLPLFVLFALVAALSVGIWLSALNVQYRDFRYTLPFLTQLWMFASPVAYSSSLVPPQWRVLYGLNPMAGVIDGFRWALLGSTAAPGPQVLISLAIVLLLLGSGLLYFRRMERTFADIV